jgi:sarcosine oxidase subunit alpha
VSKQENRLSQGGRIDRAASFTMRFDGREVRAFGGDTLASALLGNGVRVVARSFKYHRPRGVFAAGVEEPNALVRLREGARAEPNSRATTIEAYPGLRAASQNAWPSLRFDVAALSGALQRLLPAGFYYKTFIGPGAGIGWWMFCESFIRRAAGRGRAAVASDPDVYEKVNAFCDVLVVGGGRAGLAAALAAGRAGARVVLAEQDFALGGSLLACPPGSEGDAWLAAVEGELHAIANVRILLRSTVFGAYDGEIYGVVERVSDHLAAAPEHQPRQRYWIVRTKSAVLAAGAIEQPLVFTDNDLPGVMLATAARSYLNRHAVRCGSRVVVFTGNDAAYVLASELALAGAAVALVDLRRNVPEALARPARRSGIDVVAGHAVVRAHGGQTLEAVTIAPIDLATGRVATATRRITCDLLATSGGFAPTLHLFSQRGGKPRYDAALGSFVAGVGAPALLCAGSSAGRDGLGEAIRSGFAAGTAAARRAGREGGTGYAPEPPGEADAGSWSREPAVLTVVRRADGSLPAKAFIDLEHDVTCADVELAHREGYVSIEHLKRYTTIGMGSDQGKTSNVNALSRLAALRGVAIPDVGTTTFRPPYTPIPFGTLVGRVQGRHFRPIRRSPMHAWHARHGAVFIEAGGWLRPWYYPREGEGAREAAIREAGQVRSTAGLVDVSSLGKIAVEGPHAAQLLDRVYVNGFASLKVGELRYGVMLREDGFVFDDGVTARLAATQFFMTTTTGNADKVLAFLERLLQTAWTELEVHVTSVTDQWGAIAVAGPHARRLLAAACVGTDLAAASLPNMRWREASIAGVPARIHRMSYSGELAYEVYVPSGHAELVWEALMAAGNPLGVLAYGTEAMGTLRIEKGHLGAAEIDGRTTLRDLALDRLVRATKPCVGSVLRRRPLLEDPQRPSLVGLVALDPARPIKAGSLLFAAGAPIAGHGEGHVTSATYSPALGTHIALALLARGLARRGEVVRCVDLLDDTTVEVRVGEPCAFDREGVRQHA